MNRQQHKAEAERWIGLAKNETSDLSIALNLLQALVHANLANVPDELTIDYFDAPL